jgi:hypothetical protein
LARSTTDPDTYSGWQREKGGFFFGLDAVQTAFIALAALTIIDSLLRHSWSQLLISLPIAGGLVAAALVRIEGKTTAQWIQTYLAVISVRAHGAHRFEAQPRYRVLDGEGEIAPPPDAADEWDLPGVLAPLRLLGAENAHGESLAVVHHRVDNTYTAVARVTHPGLALLASRQANNRVHGWASWLAHLCAEDGVICRIGVYHTAEPGEVDELAEWAQAHVGEDSPPAAVDLVGGILAADRRKVAEHTSYLSISLSAKRSRREIRNAGGGADGACAVLARRINTIASSIVQGGAQVDHWLEPRELAGVIRTSFAPLSRRELGARGLRARRPDWAGADPGVPAALAGPTWAETSWGVYEHDGSWSVVAEIEWPRTPRDASMLAGLLAASDKGRRQLAIIYEPIAPRQAERALQTDKTKRDVAIRLRQKTGQIPPEREQRELAVASAQDVELASGHGLLRFTGYVAVTVTDRAVLEDAWDELCADAGATGIVLRRCSGWVDTAFACASVPVGMGLPGRGQKA